MKAIKYVLMGSLLLGTVSPMMAQTDNKAILDQATTIIKAKGADYKDQVKQLYKENKKNPEVLVALGRIFLAQNDTANAMKFADYALAKNGKYAPAFILKGDIDVAKDDAGGAAGNYQQAIYFDPKDPKAYYNYAMILRGRSPEEAVATLEQLRQARPDYPVDGLCGRIYYKAQRYPDAEKYYDKVGDLKKLEDEDLTYYAMSTWLLGKRDKSIDICKVGLERDPRRAGWNRIAFYNYTDLKNAEQALNYADKLFNQSDSAHFIGEDYMYYGAALQQANRLDDAIHAYDKALELSQNEPKRIALIDKNLSDLYLKKKDYDKAVEYYEKSFGDQADTMDNMDNLGTLYADIASKQTQDGDIAAATESFKKADSIYAAMMAKYPNYGNYCNYMRGQINSNLDPDSKQGLALPFYQDLVTGLMDKENRSASENSMLQQALLYLIGYSYNVKKDLPTTKKYAEQLLTIDPENAVAKQVMELK